jgi:hypothetical protein
MIHALLLLQNPLSPGQTHCDSTTGISKYENKKREQAGNEDELVL